VLATLSGVADQQSARVMLINRFYSHDARVPTARLMADLADDLCRNGISVAAVHTARHEENHNRLGGITRLCALPALLMKALFSNRRPDLIVVLSDPPLAVLVGVLLGALWRVPVIYWCHDIYPDILQNLRWPFRLHRLLVTLSRPVHRWLVDQCDQVIVPSACMRSRLYHHGVRRVVRVVPNWPEHCIKPAQALPPCGRLRLLYSGHYGIGHDLSDLLQAARHWHGQGRPIDLHLALSARGEQRLRKAFAHDAGLLRHVTIGRLVPVDRLNAHLAAAHIHIVSIRPEAAGSIMPCKSAASLKLGRPILLLGGAGTELADMIANHKIGHIAESGDVSGLVGWVTVISENTGLLKDMADNAGRLGQKLFQYNPTVRLTGFILRGLQDQVPSCARIWPSDMPKQTAGKSQNAR
jgi:colanic acid biosynthesis glycosyl transferase WcaI